jgi:uncharacterized RmlC-like cupin family protein
VSGVRVIKPGDRTDTAQTAGMTREEAATGPGYWSGIVTAEPGTVSGWHHHGDHDSVVYVVSGIFRVESGADGRDVADASAGDFMLISKGAVHREINPGEETSTLVVVRVGSGEPVFNVDGPEPAN